jgi:MOB kinase activator 1
LDISYFLLAVDFYNELRLIWDIICEIGIEPCREGQGFPTGYEYRWAESKGSNPITCSGPQYVEFVLSWVEKEIGNDKLFPISSGLNCRSFINPLTVV